MYGLDATPDPDAPVLEKAETIDESGGCVRLDIGKLYWDVHP